MNGKTLKQDCRDYLAKFFSSHRFDDTSVVFPTVQNQLNGYDCGVFSIAFAVTSLHGLAPESVRYDREKMRSHLLHMLTANKIEHFPLDRDATDVYVPSLIDVIERDKVEYFQKVRNTDHDLTCICCP
ncbi:hypothetical protein PV325_013763 [Microctonus aethiopoides]|nr:hypothetical protein PV325_013763 [Microctonus aethiopoides]